MTQRFNPASWKTAIGGAIAAACPGVTVAPVPATNSLGRYFAFEAVDPGRDQTDAEYLAIVLGPRFADSIRDFLEGMAAEIGTQDIACEVGDLVFVRSQTSFATLVRGKIRCMPRAPALVDAT